MQDKNQTNVSKEGYQPEILKEGYQPSEVKPIPDSNINKGYIPTKNENKDQPEPPGDE